MSLPSPKMLVRQKTPQKKQMLIFQPQPMSFE